MDLHNTWPERKGTVTKRAGSMRSTLHELQPRTLIFVWGGWSKSNPSRIWRPILEPPLASPTLQGVYISPRLSIQSPNPLPRGIAMEPNYMSPEEGPRQSANRVQETLYRDLLLYRWPKHLRLQLRQVPRIQNQSPFQPQNGPTPSADSWPSGRKKATATRSPPNSRLPMI